MPINFISETVSRRIYVLFSVTVLMICLFGFGCGTKKVSRKTVIRYLNWEKGEGLKVMRDAIRDFEQRNPDIKVILESVPFNGYYSKVLTMIAAGDAPDVFNFYTNSGDIARFAEKELLYDFNKFIGEDREFNVGDYFESSLNACRYKGKLYGLPVDCNPVVLFYNKDLFDKEGLKYPDETWTWDTFLEAAKKLTKDIDGNGRIDQYGAEYMHQIETYFWQLGGDSFDDENNCLIASEECRKGLQFVRDLMLKYKVCPSITMHKEAGGSYRLFLTGCLAMLPNIPYVMPELFKAEGLMKWDVAPVPFPKGGKRVTTLLLSCYSIPKATKHPEEAWKLVKFLSGENVSRRFGKLKRSIPGIKSVANDKNLFGPPPEHIRVLIDAMEYARSPKYFVKRPEFDEHFNIQIELLLLGEQSLEKTIYNIDKRAKKVLTDR